jgi:hypothetical protein
MFLISSMCFLYRKGLQRKQRDKGRGGAPGRPRRGREADRREAV